VVAGDMSKSMMNTIRPTYQDGIDRVLGELSRCGNQFVPDIKRYLGFAE
jgi:hypothetical protein